MSSRMLKRMQLMQHGGSEKDLLPGANVLANDASEDDGDEELVASTSRKNHLNPFDLLNQFSHSESEVKEDDNETEHASTAGNLPSSTAAAKKKKKKRKKKTRYTNNHISSEDNDLTDKHVSDIEAVAGKANHAHNSKQATPKIQITKSLLQVELKHLNSHNELRRTFGKRVVKAENRRGRLKHSLKTTYIVSAKESWPPVTRNLITMKSTAAPFIEVGGDNTSWFKFEHSDSYHKIQTHFVNAVERNNSESIIELIKRCPYHVDSLIQLNELCKMTEDHAMATELIERAVYAMECVLHPSFSLTSGNCRLDYHRPENRSFFIVLFKHAQYLEMRACCRTAFEISKLILNLCPTDDPLAIILVLDYYAMRSKQYNWLIQFYEEYDKVRNLSQLPNMAYSYALALFCTGADIEKQNEALQYAVLMFPGVLLPLLEELGVQTDQRVRKSNYFKTGVSGNQSPALHQLVCLYICRAKNIWRHANILPWLEQNVNTVLDRIDRKEPIITEFSQKRATRYETPPRAILRHVILADFKEKVPLAPFIIKEKDSILTYDPLPPSGSTYLYQRATSPSSSPNTRTNGPLAMFIQSLIPSFNPNAGAGNSVANNLRAARHELIAEAPPHDIEGEFDVAQQQLEEAINLNAAIVEDAAAGNNDYVSTHDLNNSIANIMETMREFLQNIGVSDNANQAEAEIGNYTTDEDSSDYND